MHAISSYRGNRPTHPQTNKQTGPITIHRAAASLARSVIKHSMINSIPTYIQIVSLLPIKGPISNSTSRIMSITSGSILLSCKANWSGSSKNLAWLQILLKAA